jgi:hypothetical protein
MKSNGVYGPLETPSGTFLSLLESEICWKVDIYGDGVAPN